MASIRETCANCKIYLPQQKICQLMPNLQGKIEPTDFCSQFAAALYQCENCKAYLLSTDVYIEIIDEVAHTLCKNCATRR